MTKVLVRYKAVSYLTKTIAVDETLYNYILLCYVKCSKVLVPFKAAATPLPSTALSLSINTPSSISRHTGHKYQTGTTAFGQGAHAAQTLLGSDGIRAVMTRIWSAP